MELHGEHLILASVILDAAETLLPAFNGDEQFSLWSGFPSGVTVAEVQADISQTQSLPGGAIWKIDDYRGMLVGVAETAIWPQPDTGWIALLIIRREFQGRGFGAEAAALLEQHLFSYPEIRQIGLTVMVQNVSALKFWEKRGYRRRERCHDDQGHDVYKYYLPRPVFGEVKAPESSLN